MDAMAGHVSTRVVHPYGLLEDLRTPLGARSLNGWTLLAGPIPRVLSSIHSLKHWTYPLTGSESGLLRRSCVAPPGPPATPVRMGNCQSRMLGLPVPSDGSEELAMSGGSRLLEVATQHVGGIARAGRLDGLTTGLDAGEDGPEGHGRREGHIYLECGVQGCPRWAASGDEYSIRKEVILVNYLGHRTGPCDTGALLPRGTRYPSHIGTPSGKASQGQVRVHTGVSSRHHHSPSAPTLSPSGSSLTAQSNSISGVRNVAHLGAAQRGVRAQKPLGSLSSSRALTSRVARSISVRVPSNPTLARCANAEGHVIIAPQNCAPYSRPGRTGASHERL